MRVSIHGKRISLQNHLQTLETSDRADEGGLPGNLHPGGTRRGGVQSAGNGNMEDHSHDAPHA